MKRLTASLLRVSAGLLFTVVTPSSSMGAGAGVPPTSIEANTSFWWILDEQAENGLLQGGSGDEAADRASGFNFKQGRLAFSFKSRGGRVETLLRLRLEERTDIIDFWGGYHPSSSVGFYIGQMKIPSTAEVLAADHALDFVSRSTFGQNVCDYSLSRTPYISSVMASKSYDRDLGMAVKGTLPGPGEAVLDYFIMAGNGIGANKYIGGDADEFVYTNRFGDYYYGMRLELAPIPRLKLGGHASWNRHDDMALDKRGPVFDIDRSARSCDIGAVLPWRQRINGFYGSGVMKDYWDSIGYRFDYSGWGLWTMQPLLGDRIELGIRYDVFSTEFNSSGSVTDQNNWTFGVNFSPEKYLRLQLNYVVKDTVDDFEPDRDDNILFMNFQFLYDAVIVE